MSQLADYFKTRIFMAMPVNGDVAKKRLAHWTAQALNVLEKTPSGNNLLKQLPDSLYFSMRKTLGGYYGRAFGDGMYIGLACDKLYSLKEVLPVLMHECVHVAHNIEIKKKCPKRSIYEDFLFEYLSEFGARLQEKNVIQESTKNQLLLYDSSFFKKNPQFYGPLASVSEICQDVDHSYLNDFLRVGLATSCKEEDEATIRQIKTYFKKQYPDLSPQIYAHIRSVFFNKANEVLCSSKCSWLTRYEKRLLRQYISRERD